MRGYISFLALAWIVTGLGAGADSIEYATVFEVPLDEISVQAETVKVGGFELTASHPGIDHPRVSEMMMASKEFAVVTDCLKIETGFDSIDLRSISSERIDDLRQFDVCLQRIFSYLDSPQEVAAWLEDVGFSVVLPPSPTTLTYWRTTNQIDGFSLAASWREDANTVGAGYPLSMRFNSSENASYSRNLGLVIRFDDDGRVFDLRTNFAFN